MLFHFYFISALRYVASYAFSACLSAMLSPERHSPHRMASCPETRVGTSLQAADSQRAPDPLRGENCLASLASSTHGRVSRGHQRGHMCAAVTHRCG